MKINVEDLDAIIRLTGVEDSFGLRMALAHNLFGIWDRGYEQGQSDSMSRVSYALGNCPYTHSHTREWCGYAGCREG
jgi:hypothetical protein